jgi:Fe-Mn family superoxide dismutase
MSFTLPTLNYAYDALEPHIDARTMEIHHSKHHQAYVNNLNAALEGQNMDESHLLDINKNISNYPVAVRNNGGGHYNHTFFWNILSPNAGGAPKGALAEAITSQYGSFEAMKEEFNKAATTRFGSGWAWLCVKEDGALCICSTPNQDNPLMDIAECKGTPILALDVWEHAYYLNYQNRRPDYIQSFWNVVNWDKANELYTAAI